MVKAAQYLIIATLIALLFVYVARFPNHFSDPDWSAHDKAHLFSQISVGAGFTTLALIISLRWFRTCRTGVWWLLLGFGALTFGGYWLGKMFFEAEGPWRSGNTVFLVLSMSYLLGIVLGWPYFVRGDKAENPR